MTQAGERHADARKGTAVVGDHRVAEGDEEQQAREREHVVAGRAALEHDAQPVPDEGRIVAKATNRRDPIPTNWEGSCGSRSDQDRLLHGPDWVISKR